MISTLLFAALTHATAFASPVDRCAARLSPAATYDLEHPGRQLTEVLDRRPLEPNLLIDYLSHHPALRALEIENLFDLPVSEEQTFSEHVRRVLTVFRSQEKFYPVRPELKRVALLALIFHAATSAIVDQTFFAEHGRRPTSTEDQLWCSRRVADLRAGVTMTIGTELGLDERSAARMHQLTSNDPLRDVVHRHVAAEAAAEHMTALGEDHDLRPHEWWNAKNLIFIPEVGACPHQRYGHPPRTARRPFLGIALNGRVIPVSQPYQKLKALMER